MIEVLLGGTVSIALLALGYFVGSANERQHLKSLDEREQQYAKLLRANVRSLPANWSVQHAGLVQGQAVIATDYFKSFLMAARNFFGGESRTMRVLMQRARREAEMRMVEEAAALGANVVWNIRIETSEIGSDMGSKGAAIAEAFAYGTALKVDTNPAQPAA